MSELHAEQGGAMLGGSRPPKKPTQRSVSGRVLVFTFTALAVLGALAIALFGAWLGTSLAIFHQGPVWLAILGAVVCFFLVPLAWELIADRDQVGGRLRDAILRSAVLSLALILVLLATHATTTFKALATRGDWFLAGSTSPTAQSVRGLLREAADGLEWLYLLARPREFDRPEDPGASAESQPAPAPQPPVVSSSTRVVEAKEPGRDHVGRLSAFAIPGSDLTWPLPAEVHRAVRDLPEDAKRSITSVGKYLAEAEPDLFMRAKAVHDFVATWVAYDVVGLGTGAYKQPGRQDAARVFTARTAVCAGYANLMVALGRAAGLKIVFVAGDTRSARDYDDLARDALPAQGLGHAWNAVQLGTTWYLMDATWDAGHVSGDTFTPEYETTYLFIPAEAILLDHLPDSRKWQLMAAPIDRGTWLRQPMMQPSSLAFGVTLEAPRSPIVELDGPLTLDVGNPGEIWVLATLEGDSDHSTRCGPAVPTSGKPFTCDLGPLSRRETLHLFAATQRGTRFAQIGSILLEPR